LYDGNGEIAGLAIVGSNINTQKKTAKILRQQSERLSNIAWFQSHQVRRPVSSILAIMNLIKDEKDYSQINEYLQMLETTTQQLDEIIRTIVKQSREV
jgi:light-regulated signal transduction histidine kinase (bacteriophytochrome)